MKKTVPFLIAALFLVSIQFAAAEKAGKTKPEPKTAVRVESIKGTVSVCREGSKDWLPLKVKDKLGPKDIIRTGKNSEVRLVNLKDNTAIRINEKKKMTVSEVCKPVRSSVSLKKAMSKFKKGKNDEGVTAVAGVRGDDKSKKGAESDKDQLKWKDESR